MFNLAEARKIMKKLNKSSKLYVLNLLYILSTVYFEYFEYIKVSESLQVFILGSSVGLLAIFLCQLLSKKLAPMTLYQDTLLPAQVSVLSSPNLFQCASEETPKCCKLS